MTTRRVAVIFDDRPRPETTGAYVLRAFRELWQLRLGLEADLARTAQSREATRPGI